ncbi:MAG TPA: dicarboxylate/amino acid:cation symporter, partial [Gillisia sp.]|nr:dicarboxylate/amino acid:cation symporter [Gillisia sp.]
MAAGIVFALLLSNFYWGTGFIRDWIKPFGTIFINSLKLIAVPLILASLIKGVSDLGDLSKLSKMGSRTIITFILTTFVAVSIGLICVNLIKPGNTISEETRNNLLAGYANEVTGRIELAQEQKESGPLQALEDIVPSNIFFAASDNTKMLQVIFFAIIFGISLILIPSENAKPVKDFFNGFNDVILKMIDIIMKGAPYGVFALMAALVVESPDSNLFSALALYAITVIAGLFLMLGVYAAIVYISSRTNPKKFFKAIAPAQLLAFSTSSSAATLPVTMECVENNLRVPKEVASFVLP